jgi:hypothetical protein
MNVSTRLTGRLVEVRRLTQDFAELCPNRVNLRRLMQEIDELCPNNVVLIHLMQAGPRLRLRPAREPGRPASQAGPRTKPVPASRRGYVPARRWTIWAAASTSWPRCQ